MTETSFDKSDFIDMKAFPYLWVITLVVLGWIFRFEITPLNAGETAYLLNRWTGTVYLLDMEASHEVKPAK